MNAGSGNLKHRWLLTVTACQARGSAEGVVSAATAVLLQIYFMICHLRKKMLFCAAGVFLPVSCKLHTFFSQFSMNTVEGREGEIRTGEGNECTVFLKLLKNWYHLSQKREKKSF